MVFLTLGKRIHDTFQALGQKARGLGHHLATKAKHFATAANQWVSDIKTGQYHFPGYNYMGPGTQVYQRIQEGLAPTSKTDHSAMHHDLDYGKIGQELKSGKIDKRELTKKVREADKRFVHNLEKSGESHHLGNFIGKNFIKGKMWLEDIGLMNPEQFTGD